MPIDRRHIGYAFPTFTVVVDRARIQAFVDAVGVVLGADGIAPPTFLKAVEGEHDSSRAILTAIGVDLKRVLHAEQQFDYVVPIRADDRLSVTRTVTDICEKKNGALEFITIESVIRFDTGLIAARSRQLILVRNPIPEDRA